MLSNCGAGEDTSSFSSGSVVKNPPAMQDDTGDADLNPG